MSSDPSLNQDEIEALLKQAQGGGATSPPPAANAAPAGPSISQNEIEALLNQTQSSAGKPPEPGVTVDQNEIEALLNQAKKPSAPAASAKPASKPAAAVAAPKDEDASKKMSQSDIEALFSKAGPAQMVAKGNGDRNAQPDPAIQADDVELLLQQAEAAIRSIDEPQQTAPPGARGFNLEEFRGAAPNQEVTTIQLLRDVELDLKIELGRTHMYLEEVLKLRKGSVVPLDKLAGDPVDIYVNGRLIARGEVLVMNDNFCVRVAELITAESAAAG
ncbi:MAG: flagellar motor switch protein FliN [Planctomycetaceae bacterium]|nr:flagellar motor switch protein FliN [Planctomycetaceae bacterium]